MLAFPRHFRAAFSAIRRCRRYLHCHSWAGAGTWDGAGAGTETACKSNSHFVARHYASSAAAQLKPPLSDQDTNRINTLALDLNLMDLRQEVDNFHSDYPNSIVLIQVGGFYEIFDNNGQLDRMASTLRLAIGTRKSKRHPPIRFTGFPTHQLSKYLKLIVEDGNTVVLVDQLGYEIERRLMKRAVSRIVSPGTLINDEGINNTNSFVLLIAPPSETNRSDKISSSSSHSATAPFGICWYDINTGELFYSQSCLQQLSSDLARISPVEIVLYDQAPEASSHIFLHLETTKKSNPDQHSFKITFLDSSHFDQSQLHDGHQRLSKLAGTTTTTTINSNIKLLSLDMSRSEELAVISMLNFLEYSFQGIFDHAGRWIQFPVKFDSQDCMKMDHAVVRALELNRTMNQGRQKGSVIQVLDETKTAQGSRMLQSRLRSPCTRIAEIKRRHDLVEAFYTIPDFITLILPILGECGDLEKLVQRLHLSAANASDLFYIHQTLVKSLELKKRIQRLSKRLSSSSKNCSLALKEILKKLEFDVKALDVMHGLYSNQVSVQEQNFTESVKKQGNSNKRMDSIREKLAELDSKKQQFVADIFGKYGVNIEPKSVRGEGAVIHFKGRVAKYCRDALAKDPQVTFVSSSSSKNGGGNSSRFSHKEWTLLHAEINKAKESLAEAEDLFLRDKCQEMAAYSLDLLRISSAIAQIDVAASSATVALNNAHVRPIMVEAPIYNVKQSRHPIVEYTQKELPGGFVGNDLNLGTKEKIWVITGPNMGGKSTFLRQSALLSVLAQAGMFVPATYAELGIVDQILSRMGSSDNLTGDQSSFMVEMIETEKIMRMATPRSLIILDEVGRGTSPRDALALCYGILKYCSEKLVCRTLFATHYAQLFQLIERAKRESTEEQQQFENVAFRKTYIIEEVEDEAIFTYKLVDGVSTVSHGLFVAKIAGMPAEIIESAKDIIFEEGLGGGTTGGSLPSPLAPGHFKAVQRAETLNLRIMRWKLKIATFVCAVAFAAAESPRLDGFLDDFSLISGKLTTSNKRITRRGIEDFDTADITRTTIYYKDLALTMTLSPDHLLVSSKLTINTNHFLKGSLDFIPNSIVRLNLIPGTDSFEGIIHFGELNFGPLFIDSLSRFSNVSTHPATHHSVIYSLGDLSHKSRPSNHRNNIFNNHLVRRSNRKHLSKRRAAAATLTVEDLKQIIALAILKDVNPSVSSNGLIRPSSSSSSPITATIATTTSSTKLIPSLPPVKIVSVTPVAPTTTTTTPAPPPPPPSPPPPPPSPSPTSSAHSSPQPQGICKAAVIADNSFFEAHQNEPGGIDNFIIGIMNQVSGFYEQQLGIALQVDFNFVEKNHQSACGLASTPNDPSQVVPFVNKAAECLPNYPAQDLCISMVLTSVEFQETAVGVANVKAICLPGQNTGIASDSGVNGRLTRPEFLSVFMHEIGHLFGSQHDSPGTTCGNVDANQRFVMFPSVQPDSSNKFVFSQCSLSAIQQTLSEPSHQCWKNGGGGGSSLRDSFSSPSLDDTFATPTFSSPSPSIIIDYHHHLH